MRNKVYIGRITADGEVLIGITGVDDQTLESKKACVVPNNQILLHSGSEFNNQCCCKCAGIIDSFTVTVVEKLTRRF